MLNIELRDLILAIVKTEITTQFGIACIATDIREDEDLGFICTATPIDESPAFDEAKLTAQSDGNLLFLPEEGSIVYVMEENETDSFVCMYGKIASIVFLGGSNGGVVKVESLVEKLNNLESGLNTHTHASNGAPPTPPPITATTVKEDLENELFKH